MAKFTASIDSPHRGPVIACHCGETEDRVSVSILFDQFARHGKRGVGCSRSVLWINSKLEIGTREIVLTVTINRWLKWFSNNNSIGRNVVFFFLLFLSEAISAAPSFNTPMELYFV